MVPAHDGTAAFKVFDNVEDLLALRLPHHPTYIQQGGDMLLPVGRKDAKRKKSRQVSTEIESVWCRQRLSSFLSNSYSLCVRGSVSGKAQKYDFIF